MKDQLKSTSIKVIGYLLPAIIAFIILLYIVRAIVPDWLWELMS